MADIVISEFMDLDAVEGLAAEFDVLYEPDLVDRPDELATAVAPARGLIVRNRTQVRGALLEVAASLRVVGRLGVGLDNIDTATCDERGIQVFPATGANSASVAEYVMVGLMMAFRGAFGRHEAMLAGEWPRAASTGREICGRKLGLIGFGNIARVVASKAQALGMTVVAHDPMIADDDPVWTENRVAPVNFDDVLQDVDAVSLHVPLTEQTHRLIDADAIHRMRSDAVLVNTARGGIVDEAALAKALADGLIAGAVLDVFDNEPMPADNPFVGVPNVILTPHIAGVTEESNVRVSRFAADCVRRVLSEA